MDVSTSMDKFAADFRGVPQWFYYLYAKATSGDNSAKQALTQMFHDESNDKLQKLAKSNDYDGKMAKDEISRRDEAARQAAEQAAKQAALANIKGSSYDVKIGANGVPVSINNASEAQKYQNNSGNSYSSFPAFSFSQLTSYQSSLSNNTGPRATNTPTNSKDTSQSFFQKIGSSLESVTKTVVKDVNVVAGYSSAFISGAVGSLDSKDATEHPKTALIGKISGDLTQIAAGAIDTLGGVAVTLSSLPQFAAAPVDGGLTIATGAVTVTAGAAITTAGVTTAVNGALNTGSDFSDLVNKFKGGSSEGTGKVVDLNIKPAVSNEKLNNIINNLYKGQNNPNKIGNGTTMDAIRNEVDTGLPTGGTFHSTKGQESINGLNNVLKKGGLSPEDTKITKELIQDLTNALSGKR